VRNVVLTTRQITRSGRVSTKIDPGLADPFGREIVDIDQARAPAERAR